jgi:hypothetical protein
LLRTAAFVTRTLRRVAARRGLAPVAAVPALTSVRSLTALATITVTVAVADAVVTRWTTWWWGLLPAGRLLRPRSASVAFGGSFWAAITVVAVPIVPWRPYGLAGALFAVAGRPARRTRVVVEVAVPGALTARRTVVLVVI